MQSGLAPDPESRLEIRSACLEKLLAGVSARAWQGTGSLRRLRCLQATGSTPTSAAQTPAVLKLLQQIAKRPPTAATVATQQKKQSESHRVHTLLGVERRYLPTRGCRSLFRRDSHFYKDMPEWQTSRELHGTRSTFAPPVPPGSRVPCDSVAAGSCRLSGWNLQRIGRHGFADNRVCRHQLAVRRVSMMRGNRISVSCRSNFGRMCVR